MLLESAPQGRRRLQSFFPKSVREDDLYKILRFFGIFSDFCFFFQFFVFFSDFSTQNQNTGVNKKNTGEFRFSLEKFQTFFKFFIFLKFSFFLLKSHPHIHLT